MGTIWKNSEMTSQGRQYTYNLILWRLRVTIFVKKNGFYLVFLSKFAAVKNILDIQTAFFYLSSKYYDIIFACPM